MYRYVLCSTVVSNKITGSVGGLHMCYSMKQFDESRYRERQKQYNIVYRITERDDFGDSRVLTKKKI